MKEFPKKVPYSLLSNIVCYLADDFYALEGVHKGALYELTARDKIFSVFGEQAPIEKSDFAIPLYRLGENGAPVVPTGLIFVRFSDEIDVRSMESSLQSIGYRIANEKTGHQNAAWLEAIDRSIATSIANVCRLGSLKGIKEVQPQFLSKRAKR